MFTCERCGAGLPPKMDQCAYCGTVSGPAQAYLRVEAARVAQLAAPIVAQTAIAHQLALAATEQAASRALLWGMLSPIFVCLPFPSLLAWLAFNRAKRTAQQAGIALPQRAGVGLSLAAISVLGFVGLFIWLVIDIRADDARVDARKAELAKVVTRYGTSPTLNHEFACALAETSLLSDGFAGSTNTGAFRDLDCAGAPKVVKDRAELDDFKLRTSSSSDAVSATICFKHGDHWFVERTGFTSCELSP